MGSVFMLLFAGVFLAFSLDLFGVLRDAGFAGFGIRVATAGAGAIGLFFAVYLGIWGLRGRNPAAGSERARVREQLTAEGPVTRYHQARARTLLNLAAASAASLLAIGFVVLGLGVNQHGFVAIGALLGSLIVPFTVRGWYHAMTQPVVLELSGTGVTLRGHRLVRWDEIAALRIERLGGRRRAPIEPGQEGPSTRRLGVVLKYEPSGFDLTKALSGGAFSSTGVAEQELPVPLEEVVTTAQRYHAVEVQGREAAPPAPAPLAERVDQEVGADQQAVVWRGSPVTSKVQGRRVAAQASAIGHQLLGLLPIAAGMSFAGHPQAIPLVLAIFIVIIGSSSGLASVRSTRRAVAAAARRRYWLTQDFLVTESRGQRHERRLTRLPELRLSLEGDGVGTIWYAVPSERQGIPDWLRRLVPPPVEDDSILVESVPDAERLFHLLIETRGVATDAATREPPIGVPAITSGAQPAAAPLAAPAAVAAGSAEPVLVRRVPGSLLRFATIVPWLSGPICLLTGVAVVIMVSAGPWHLGALIAVIFSLTMGGLGGLVSWAHLTTWRERRRILRAGARTMARVRGLADANVEINEVDQWVVQYEYEAGGATYVAESGMLPMDDASRWAAGDRVQIAYDPVHPELSVWLGGESLDDS